MNERIQNSMKTAISFRKKHDKSGGMLCAEYQLLIDKGMENSEGLYEAITYAYSLGYRRGYNQGKKRGENMAKKEGDMNEHC